MTISRHGAVVQPLQNKDLDSRVAGKYISYTKVQCVIFVDATPLIKQRGHFPLIRHIRSCSLLESQLYLSLSATIGHWWTLKSQRKKAVLG